MACGGGPLTRSERRPPRRPRRSDRPRRPRTCEHLVGVVGVDREHHAQAHVERAEHVLVGRPGRVAHEAEHGARATSLDRSRAPSPSGSARGRFSWNPPPGDVRGGLHQAIPRECEHVGRIDRARLQQLVGERASGQLGRRVVERVAVEEGVAHERVAVRVQPARGQADQHVAQSHALGPAADASSTAPTQNPARSNRSSGIVPGCSAVSPPSSAHPARRHPSATPLDDRPPPAPARPPDGQVVEEEQRLGARAHHVVGAHRHQVDAHRVEAAGQPGDLELGADAVGGGREQLAVADAEQPREPADPVGDLGAARSATRGRRSGSRPSPPPRWSTPARR